MKITKHAYDRGKERMGFNKSALKKMAEKALKDGIRHKDVNGKLQKYLDHEYLSRKKANALRIYGEFLYYFAGSTLLTVVRLDNKFTKIINKL